ncbi:MAG: aspartate kinase [Blastocatellia bacterium]|jgi:aspartate kinase|nr:aspartate kinase [Blastocatellia bacterium]
MKFGGTSVEDAPAFARVGRIVKERVPLRPVVIVSAMSGLTDTLIECVRRVERGENERKLLEQQLERHGEVARELLSGELLTSFLTLLEKSRAELFAVLQKISERGSAEAGLRDRAIAFGEDLSSNLLELVLREQGVMAKQFDSRRCIITNDEHGSATPIVSQTFRNTKAFLRPLLAADTTPVLGGFIAANANGETTTLGRGGSDYSAALIGAALGASEIQIWTDVNGVLTADPRVVAGAHTVPHLSYAEAAELAYFGAKVLHPKTIQPAVESGIPVRICNSRAPDEPGTLVCAEGDATPRGVKAIAHKTGVTTIQITSARMLGAYGFLRALFELFDNHQTVVDVVTTSEVSVSLSVDAAPSAALLDQLQDLGSVRLEDGRAIVCVVGAGLRGTPGIAARVFNTISDINVSLISQGASSVNLTFAVDEQFVGQAVSRLHAEFFEATKALASNVQRPTSKVRI